MDIRDSYTKKEKNKEIVSLDLSVDRYLAYLHGDDELPRETIEGLQDAYKTQVTVTILAEMLDWVRDCIARNRYDAFESVFNIHDIQEYCPHIVSLATNYIDMIIIEFSKYYEIEFRYNPDLTSNAYYLNKKEL